MIYMGRAMRQMLIAPDDLSRDKARAQLNKARDSLRTELAEGRKRMHLEKNIALYEQFQQDFTKYNENLEHAVALIEREKHNASVAAAFVASPDFTASGSKADEQLTEMTKVKEHGTKAIMEKAKQRSEHVRWIAMLLLLFGLGIAVLFGILVGTTIKRPNERLRLSVEELAEGKVDSPIPHTDYPNEIGVMARALKVLQEIYRKADDQHWVKTHTAQIAADLQQAEDFETLAKRAISAIAPAVKAGHGLIYVLNGDHLNLLASYGYRERKHLNNGFAVGEGLVGQCAMERTPITLTAPQDYIRINSGLGEAPPACVSVLPIIHGERMLGVLEIASFQQFVAREVALIDAVVPVLATGMEIMDRNQRTRELLVSTQEQAQRMEKQAAQLEEQSVEMEAQQAELRETESWFRSIIETAPDGMLIFDEGGTIVLANPEADRLLGFAPGELLGSNVDRLVSDRAHDGHGALRQQAGSKRNILALRKDGSELTILVSLSLLPALGNRGRCISAAMREVAGRLA